MTRMKTLYSPEDLFGLGSMGVVLGTLAAGSIYVFVERWRVGRCVREIEQNRKRLSRKPDDNTGN